MLFLHVDSIWRLVTKQKHDLSQHPTDQESNDEPAAADPERVTRIKPQRTGNDIRSDLGVEDVPVDAGDRMKVERSVAVELLAEGELSIEGLQRLVVVGNLKGQN